ncbi:MAG: UPF0175 family protein [Phycisphaeraceae bacterium]|jgi:predicted HTH domain antitoxin|nr:UPF0175 family protein [Phycisphaeraceae bacterium]
MVVNIDVPAWLTDALAASTGQPIDVAAREALLIEAYRRRLLSVGKLAEILGINSTPADRWLADRGVPLNYDVQDLEADRKTIDRLKRGGA